jgi:hypothetical protein
MAKDSRWVDPAPLEVSRPRLPWWTMLPGWVKLVLSPVAAVVLLCWTGYQVGRAVYRYPLLLALLVAGWWSYSGLGRGGLARSWPFCLAGWRCGGGVDASLSNGSRCLACGRSCGGCSCTRSTGGR